MPQNGKTPSTLAELAKLVDSVDDGEGGLEYQWLTWTYNFLTSRKAYHKKQQLKKKMMMKVASEHLSEDELAEIEAQAERLSGQEPEI
jgi:hypothetical protein